MVEENGNRKVAYADKKEIMDGIVQKYHPEWLFGEDVPPNAMPVGGQNLSMAENHSFGSKASGKKSGGMLRTGPRNVPSRHRAEAQSLEMTKSDD